MHPCKSHHRSGRINGDRNRGRRDAPKGTPLGERDSIRPLDAFFAPPTVERAAAPHTPPATIPRHPPPPLQPRRRRFHPPRSPRHRPLAPLLRRLRRHLLPPLQ